MCRKIFTLIVSASVLSFAGTVNAATTINFMLKQPNLPADVPQTAYIDGGKILIKAAGGEKAMDLLFQQSNETMTIINHVDRTTLDIDAEKVAALANQAQGMMSVVQQQMVKQMENMSEADREKFKKMIESMGGGQLIQAPPPPSPPKTYKDAGKQSINGYHCKLTEIFEGSEKVAETCTAEPETIGLSTKDYAVVQAMQAMSQKLQEQTAKISGKIGQNIPQFGDTHVAGVPVLMKDKIGNSMTITSIEDGIGDASLSKPEGYAPTQMPSLPGL